MMKKTKRFVLLLTTLLLFAFALPAAAASARSQAMKAYAKFMAQKEKDMKAADAPNGVALGWYQQFGLIYLDGDSVPELVTQAWAGKPIVLTYKNGKLICHNYAANSSYTHYYKKKSCLRDKGAEFTGYVHIPVGKGKLTANQEGKQKVYYADMAKISRPYLKMNGIYYKFTSKEPYQVRITKKQAAALLKKYVGSTKATKIKYYKNNSKNRTKYLK